MSNRRSILFLLFAILILTGVHVFVRYFDVDRQIADRTTLIDSSETVSTIVIRRLDEAPIILERRDGWRLTHPYPGDVDEIVVMKFLDALQLRPIPDVISHSELLRTGRTPDSFALARPYLTIEVRGVDFRQSVSFGTPTASADGIYATVSGIDAVFIVPPELLDAVDLTADRFRRHSLFAANVDVVSEFDVRSGTEAPQTFVRAGDAWTVAGKKASSARVNDFLSKLSSSLVKDFIWPVGSTNEGESVSVSLLAGYGLDPETAVTVTLKDAVGTNRQISFGKTAGEGLVYALVHEGSAIATVPESLRTAVAQGAALFVDTRLFPLDARAVSSFSIAEDGVVYALVRDDKGGWRLESPIAARADSDVAEAVLARILTLSAPDVDPDGVSLTVSTNTSPVRVRKGLVFGSGGALALRARQMLKIDAQLVKRIVRTFDGAESQAETLTFARDQQIWKCACAGRDLEVNAQAMTDLLAALDPLTAERVERLKVSVEDLKGYGLDTPFLTIAIDQDREDAIRRNVLIGGVVPGGRYATIGSSDAIFVIGESLVGKLSATLTEK